MYNPMEVSRIDRQIEDLQRLKASYQNMPQPMNNMMTTMNSTSNLPAPTQPMFEAKFTTENPADVYVMNKTAFIDLKNGKLTIKETDGEMKEYFIILPKDEKDLKIENLERKLKEMEARLNSYNMANIDNTMSTMTPATDTYTNPTAPIVVNNYDVVEDTKSDKKGLMNKLKLKN